MVSRMIIAALVGVIAIQFYANVYAGRDDDNVGEIDCIIRDIEINGYEIGRVDAVGYLTDID